MAINTLIHDYVEAIIGDLSGMGGLAALGIVTAITTIFVMSLYTSIWAKDVDVLPKRDASLPKPTEVVQLRIYPIKSCRGIVVNKAGLTTTGLDLDRHWMFIDATERKFLTIRSDPSMTLIDTSLSPDWQQLTISIHGSEDKVTIPAYPTREWLEQNTTLGKVEIWGEQTDAWEYSAEINAIFSCYFDKDVALVYKGPEDRMCAINAQKEKYGEDIAHHFADVMSLQVASQASIDDLNRRLKEKGHDEELTIERFRPNIIVKGNEPWEEDSWKRVQIVTMMHEVEQLRRVNLDVVARCARCQVPNVNPDTAEKHSKEPWETMMKFRRVDKGGPAKYKPCFGMLCVPKATGQVRVGSTLEVLELTDKHLYNEAKFKDL